MSYNLSKHIQYNCWANETLMNAILKADESCFEMAVTGSFPSLKKTICHIWDAEVIWFNRIKGISLSSWPSNNFTGTKDEHINEFLNHTQDFSAYFNNRPDYFFDEVISFTTLKGTEHQQTIGETIFHVVNHGSYHRGQIANIMRTLNFETVPSTDIIYYLRQS